MGDRLPKVRLSNSRLRLQMRRLTHYRPAMPFGNRKKYFRESFQFSIITISKILPLWKPEIY